MNFSDYQELKSRGSFDFPIELHHVDKEHPRYQMPLHWHMEYEIIRVLSGSLKLTQNEETIVLNTGDASIIQDGVLHSAVAYDCVYECIVFDFTGFLHGSTICKKDLDEVQKHQKIIDKKFDAGSDETDIINKLFATLIGKDNGYEFITQGMIFILIGTFMKNHRYTLSNKSTAKSLKRVHQLKSAISLIKSQYMSDLTLDDLSQAAGMSPKYFCKFFSDMTGKTPIEYLNYYRIESACEQLLSSDCSVTDVCMNCGFNDLSYFVKTFKRYKGITPKQYKLSKMQ